MPRVTLLLFIGLGLATPALQSMTNDPVSAIVDLRYTKYRGQDLENGIKQWLGMRFAAPPLGDLRFRAPADPIHVAEIQDASEVRDDKLN